MAYQSFQTINDALPQAVRSNFSRAIIQAQSSADAVVNVATSTIAEYARLYSQVQRLKYDTSGNVTDVTPVAELTIPQSAIATLKQSMNDLNKLINWYDTMPDSVEVDATVNRTLRMGGQSLGGNAVNYTATIAYPVDQGSGFVETCPWVDLSHGLAMMYALRTAPASYSYKSQLILEWQDGADVKRYVVQVPVGGSGSVGNLTVTSSAVVNNKSNFSAVSSDLAELRQQLDQVTPASTASDTTLEQLHPNGIVISDQPEQIQASFNIAQALRAVIAPYQALISAIEGL